MKNESYAAIIFKRTKSLFMNEEVYTLEPIKFGFGGEKTKNKKRVFITDGTNTEIPFVNDVESSDVNLVYGFPLTEKFIYKEDPETIQDMIGKSVDMLFNVVFYQKINKETKKMETFVAPFGEIETRRIHMNDFSHCANLMKKLFDFKDMIADDPALENDYENDRLIEQDYSSEEQERLHKEKEKELNNTFLALDEPKKEIYASDIFDEVSKTVICQDEQIKSVATSIAKNQRLYNQPNIKDNILICGPTGVGKTEMMKCISQYLNLPIAFEDATRFTVAGYVGASVEEMLIHLLINAGEDLNKAERGLLIIDEIDKLAGTDKSQKVSTIGVQESILKMLDGTVTEIKYGRNSVNFDTSNLTIVGMGAFSGIGEEKQSKTIGFGASEFKDTIKDNKEKYSTDSFTKYGLLPELIGRMGKVVTLNPLSVENLIHIIKHSNKSNLILLETLLRELKIKLSYDERFVEDMAIKAHKIGIGARSLKRIIEQATDDAMYKILSKNNYTELILNSETLEDNKQYILR